MGLRALYNRFDCFQQRHAWLGFPLAVRQKYSDDQGGYLAATITYYGFFAVFPLLLVFVTVLGFVLRGHPHLEDTIVNSALGQFPVVGRQLRTHSLQGSGLALVLGLAVSLWSGMGVFLASENAMNQLWGVPYSARPDFFRRRGRALLLLLVLGGGVLATTSLAWIGTAGARYALLWKVGSIGSRRCSTSGSSGSPSAFWSPTGCRGAACAAAPSRRPSGTRCCRRSAATTSATRSRTPAASTAPSAW